MTRLAYCLMLLDTGASATENVIDVQHDSQRGVTCNLLNGVSGQAGQQPTACRSLWQRVRGHRPGRGQTAR